MNRPENLAIDLDNMNITHALENDKVTIIVLDGHKGSATKVEAPEHGFTIIETVRGKAVKVKFESGYLI